MTPRRSTVGDRPRRTPPSAGPHGAASQAILDRPITPVLPAVRRYIVDTSAWARQGAEPVVRARIERALDEGEIVLVTPIVLELGYSARNVSEWDRLHKSLSQFAVLPASVHTHAIALELQRALWSSGKVRAAGSFDTMVAASAIEHGATVLHYDADYEHLATADDRLAQEWVAPRGSLT